MPYSAIINKVGDATSYNSTIGKLYASYDVILATERGNDYDVKDELNSGGQQKIRDLLGDNIPSDVEKAMNLFSNEAAAIDPKV